MRILLLVGAWLFALLAFAVPAKQVKRTITLVDGTLKEVVLKGDEHVHFYEDAEGNAYVLCSDEEDAKAGREIFCVADKEQLTSRWSEKQKVHNERRINRAKKWGLLQDDGMLTVSHNASSKMRKSQWGAESNPIMGNKRGLVILVDFDDTLMRTGHTQSFFNDYFNQEGFSQDGMSGSVHDYFWECSYGKFNLTFDVVGPVIVSNYLAYYGSNDMYGDDKHVGEMVIEACGLADELGVDFSDYDWDGDGVVDQVFLLYAGYGESQGGPSYTIWPHESTLTSCKNYGDGSGPLYLDGVKIDTYAVSSELRGGSGTRVNGIGTACHEFSHCLCIPDIYDINGRNFGMNKWDLMDSGNFCGANDCGECPTAYTSYERMYCGWLQPIELTSPCFVRDMADIVSAPEAYIIYNQMNQHEYYLLENRQLTGFNRYNPGHGMLVLHVDFSESVWRSNTINTVSSHQRMTIIPADNKLSSYSMSGDTWPGTTNNTSLTDTSTPASTLFNANVGDRYYMGKPIEEITENDNGTIDFSFDGGVPPISVGIPVAYEPIDVTKDGFTASWSNVDGATDYEVELSALETEASAKASLLLSEDFSTFHNTAPYDIEVSSNMDSYTNVEGWTGSEIYKTVDSKMRLGSDETVGYVTTPTVCASEGHVSLLLECRKCNDGDAFVDVKINDVSVFSANLESYSNNYCVVVEDKGNLKFTISATSSTYISKIEVYDGVYDGTDSNVLNSSSNDNNISYFITSSPTYSFNNLNNATKYAYRVRAYVDDNVGDWSNMVEVVLERPTNETKVNDAFVNGNNVKVYDLFGRRLEHASRRGIYIVNGKMKLAK